MKKALILLSGIFTLTFFSIKTNAQFAGTFSIQAVTGLPDTLHANSAYAFGFQVVNVGNTVYSGTISFDFLTSLSQPGNAQTFGTGQVGSFAPDDSVSIPVTYTFSINSNTFDIGDNVVVVWPRAINNNSAADSLTFHVFITNLNGVEESNKANTDLKIFPNPANDFVSFTSDKREVEEVRFYDVSGKLVLHSKDNMNIFTGQLIRGLYITETTLSDGIIIRRKIIVGSSISK